MLEKQFFRQEVWPAARAVLYFYIEDNSRKPIRPMFWGAPFKISVLIKASTVFPFRTRGFLL
jgi:hypothetical protein